jgi:hypothetical protein
MALSGTNLQNVLEHIKTTTDLAYLMRVIAIEQSEYWYDPCGKSGNTFDRWLTDASVAATKRAQELLNLDVD